mmetsp:Transcript_28735/g.85686  ORF Transcript_28735/g.85686 Transcript_28735/m.85686 type:complete len:382 (+) Transcript_28735:1084-2229(+)
MQDSAALLEVVPVDKAELVLAPRLTRILVRRVLIHLQHRRLVGDEVASHGMTRAPARSHVLVDFVLGQAEPLLAGVKVGERNRRHAQVAHYTARLSEGVLHAALGRLRRLSALLLLRPVGDGERAQLEGVIGTAHPLVEILAPRALDVRAVVTHLLEDEVVGRADAGVDAEQVEMRLLEVLARHLAERCLELGGETRGDAVAATAIARAAVALQQDLWLQAESLERLLGPPLNVLRRVPLRLARHQADERLHHRPLLLALLVGALEDAVRIDAEETHAVLRPEVAGDGELDARFEEVDAHVSASGAALCAEQLQLTLHGPPGWQTVPQARLAQLEHARQQLLQLRVIDDRLGPRALCDPPCGEAIELSLVLFRHRRAGGVS